MNVRSLGFRLVAWYAGLLAGVFLLLGVLMFVGLRHYFVANMRYILGWRAHRLGNTFLLSVRGPEDEGAIGPQVKELYAPESTGQFIRISHPDGSVVYTSGPPVDGAFDPALVSPPPVGLKAEYHRREELGGKGIEIESIPYVNRVGLSYIIEVGGLPTEIERLLGHWLVALAVGLPTFWLGVVGSGYFLIRRALAPMEQVARKAEEITQHSLSERLPVPPSGDELARLSRSLNRMIGRLQDALLNSKRFLADASHELRTPLTLMRGELESLTDDSTVATEIRERLGTVLEEIERLAKIVEGLFAISRLEAGEGQAEWVSFDMAELAASTTDQISLLAHDKGIALSCEAPKAVIVDGDRARMKQVIVNLLDNAIKYTTAGGSVRVKVTGDDGHGVLEVVDTGIGIAPGDLVHVFDRFFRVDKARSREQGGAGLGLAIVKSICTAHGAQVDVESAPGHGTRFWITLPLSGTNGKPGH